MLGDAGANACGGAGGLAVWIPAPIVSAEPLPPTNVAGRGDKRWEHRHGLLFKPRQNDGASTRRRRHAPSVRVTKRAPCLDEHESRRIRLDVPPAAGRAWVPGDRARIPFPDVPVKRAPCTFCTPDSAAMEGLRRSTLVFLHALLAASRRRREGELVTLRSRRYFVYQTRPATAASSPVRRTSLPCTTNGWPTASSIGTSLIESE